ncbi:DUF3267 domain-containing protein [Trichlorobacter lovleyi]|jgi:hypothetical protein|uniref:Zincin peptidase n=1 Tax=Trichlorobacter lovleyi (strain ATCC BAA-1151 / DSM 17278 / SZ) TaxID=398767 RepID=B3E564_TRIL1|nr:DUF3267 domain-containing protein [Trichlorobacter lovleyi]ACD96051.1 conserved hypothetical protein [Trichlorobacter lovleyi SZ]
MGTLVSLSFNIMTIPGVPVHEYAHALACRLSGVRVHKVCYLRLGNPRGYVLHEQPDTAWQHIIVSVAPFVVCSLAAILLGIGVGLLLQAELMTKQHEEIAGPFLCWLAWAVGACAFPSGGDADSLWQATKSREISLFGKLLVVPVVGLIRLGQVGSFFWLDLAWGIMVGVTIPAALIKNISPAL